MLVSVGKRTEVHCINWLWCSSHRRTSTLWWKECHSQQRFITSNSVVSAVRRTIIKSDTFSHHWYFFVHPSKQSWFWSFFVIPKFSNFTPLQTASTDFRQRRSSISSSRWVALSWPWGTGWRKQYRGFWCKSNGNRAWHHIACFFCLEFQTILRQEISFVLLPPTGDGMQWSPKPNRWKRLHRLHHPTSLCSRLCSRTMKMMWYVGGKKHHFRFLFWVSILNSNSNIVIPILWSVISFLMFTHACRSRDRWCTPDRFHSQVCQFRFGWSSSCPTKPTKCFVRGYWGILQFYCI